MHRPPGGAPGLTVLDDETIEWLLNTYPEIVLLSSGFQQLVQMM